MYNQFRTNRPIIPNSEELLPKFKNDNTDYFDQAVIAISAISHKLNSSWVKSKNGSTKVSEWSGAVILRGDAENALPLALNVKEGKKAHSKPKTKRGEIKSTDSLIGTFHTHPYSEEDIERVTGAYNWDGQGALPSGGDFVALAIDSDSQDGFFSLIEAGNIRYLMLLTNLQIYKNIMAPKNAIGGTNADNMEKWLNDQVSKERDQNYDNMEKNKEAKTPMTYIEAWTKGLKKGLNKLLEENGSTELGISIYKSTDSEKVVFEKIFG